jgi:hypothetical protein
MPLESHLQSIARAGAQYQKDLAAAREAERERQEQERLEAERNSPEALRERDRALMQASANEAIAKQEAVRKAALDKAQREKDQRLEEIKFLGKVIAEELGPVLAAAIAKAFKDNQPSAQQEEG